MCNSPFVITSLDMLAYDKGCSWNSNLGIDSKSICVGGLNRAIVYSALSSGIHQTTIFNLRTSKFTLLFSM